MRAITLCLVLVAAPACAVEVGGELGRLFFTPEQRALLDLTRRAQPGAAQADDSYDGLTLSGVVTRSDGKRMVWINGRPQPVGEGLTNGRSPASASIPLPGGEGKVRLKVGQTLDPTSGKVEEGYRRAPKPAPEPQRPPVSPPAATKSAPAKSAPRAADGNDDHMGEPANASPP